MQSERIRELFLEFFRAKNHKIVNSAPIVSKDDPTLMFVNAGMNQFKEYFLGQKNVTEKRVANTQKCLRVCGKHNDLEEVGKDTYHHTMFEMLGNWSFGDYFKKQAIAWSWELLTEVFKIDKENLYVTVFQGSKEDQLPLDKEAYDLWKEIVGADKIILGSKKDNFWEMGSQGPCGPCSEIHMDLRPEKEKQKIAGRDLVNKEHPLVIEIWNLVFIQFNRTAEGTLENLPEKHVDTGMGFERLCMVLQNVQSNYDTDVFKPLIQKISQITGFQYHKNQEIDTAIRVVADHVRAVCFAIADGQLPSNTGAGYVIRRILRRAIRYGFSFLKQKEPFIFKLVPVLEQQMSRTFPELQREKKLIIQVIQQEEKSFLKTLAQGLLLLDNVLAKQPQDKIISGQKAFELYDTFGFPIDLTRLLAGEKGFSLDIKGFEKALQAQKNRSKKAAKIQRADWVILDEHLETNFVGYKELQTQVKVVRYRKVRGKKSGDYYQLVFDKTPFYAESGGQVGDTGILYSSNNPQEKIKIFNTQKENNLWIHFAKKLPEAGWPWIARVDEKSRFLISCNHSATHLMHEALRAVLGTHVVQKGSLVHGGGLRFDFSHFQKMRAEEIQKVEHWVNQKIQAQIPLEEKRNVPFAEAKKQALALFGEKYADKVRMICFGGSKELCGGTHVQNSSAIWCFKIISESAVAAGIRRIEAITNDAVRTYFQKQESVLKNIENTLGRNKNILAAIENLQKENQTLKKQIETLNKEKIQNLKERLKNEIQTENGINSIVQRIDAAPEIIKNLAYELGDEIDNLFLFVGSQIEQKAYLNCYVAKNIVTQKNIDAGKLIKALSKHIKGGGGGQKHFATAGGKYPQGIAEAMADVKNYLK